MNTFHLVLCDSDLTLLFLKILLPNL